MYTLPRHVARDSYHTRYIIYYFAIICTSPNIPFVSLLFFSIRTNEIHFRTCFRYPESLAATQLKSNKRLVKPWKTDLTAKLVYLRSFSRIIFYEVSRKSAYLIRIHVYLVYFVRNVRAVRAIRKNEEKNR